MLKTVQSGALGVILWLKFANVRNLWIIKSMAARLRTYHQDEIRSKIQASQLVNRLTDHALGKVELNSTQVRAIEILLKKTLSDLSSVEVTGNPDAPLVVAALSDADLARIASGG